MGPLVLVELHQVLKILLVVLESFSLFYIIFLFPDIFSQGFSKSESLYLSTYEGFYSFCKGPLVRQ
jgi:hypothetical protein